MGAGHISVKLSTMLLMYTLVQAKDENLSRHLSVIEMLTIWIFLISNWVNPIFYSYKSKQFKQAFKKLLGFMITNNDHMEMATKTKNSA